MFTMRKCCPEVETRLCLDDHVLQEVFSDGYITKADFWSIRRTNDHDSKVVMYDGARRICDMSLLVVSDVVLHASSVHSSLHCV